MTQPYQAKSVESAVQAAWTAADVYRAREHDPRFPKGKFYCVPMLPYPSGEPHVGHLKNYAIGDAIAQFRRRHGFEVIHPMGYDSFGLPAENNAIKTGEAPRVATERSIASFRRQFEEWGISIDWSRELATHTPEYYRWTQWIFLRLFERGLAYRAEAPVQWCPEDATVLANEQVIDGRCERCGTEVIQRNLEQWFFRITEYADRLLADFEALESWPEHVVTMQRNWIGRSEGAEVVFRCDEVDLDFPVFTTRPDTLFGATFMSIAAEHPLALLLGAGTPREAEIRAFVDKVRAEDKIKRGAEDYVKEGIDTGARVIKAARVSQASDVQAVGAFRCAFHLLDTYKAGVPGGTGETFDWKLAVERRSQVPLILSGGLNAENVGDAIRTVRLFGVDVSSGVESAPGIKDHDAMAAFAQAVADAIPEEEPVEVPAP